eukprot:gene6686-12241_t
MESISFARISMGGLSEIEPGKEHKILGLNWDLNEENFVFKLANLAEFGKDLEWTKRNILRFPAKLFHPLGLIALIIVPVRLLFQELCRRKYDWDEPLSEGEQEFIVKWLKDLENVSIAVKRCYVPINEEIESSYLHVIGDASKKAYCAAKNGDCGIHKYGFVETLLWDKKPADLGSRGCFALQIVDNLLWWDGPNWLRGPPECYPLTENMIEEEEMLEECQNEVRLQSKKVISLLTVPEESNCRTSRVIDCIRFSSWKRLLRITSLTLKFIMLLKKSAVTSMIVEEDIIQAEDTVEKRARYLRTLLGHFWRRWNHEYLQSLREHHSRETNEKERNIVSGYIVIVKDENLHRGEWKIAVVEELIPSEDREIRGAKVNCKEQDKNIQSLPVDDENDKVKTVEKPDRPPRRIAAQNADLLRKLTVVDQSHPD